MALVSSSSSSQMSSMRSLSSSTAACLTAWLEWSAAPLRSLGGRSDERLMLLLLEGRPATAVAEILDFGAAVETLALVSWSF